MKLQPLTFQDGDAPFTSDPRKSYTIPARFYLDPEIYELEKEAIFYRSWLFVGHKSQLDKPGRYITAQIHEQSVFIARTTNGDIKAFYNVCQHRGHELLKGEGTTRRVVCPYHAWSYDLDGNLQNAQNTENVKGFNKCDFALKPVRIEELCGFIFVNLDPSAVPLSEQAAGLEAEIREYCPNIDDLVYANRQTYHVASNWKVLIDNFLECYHCQPAHKDFVDLVDMTSYRVQTSGIYSSQFSDVRADNSAFQFEKSDAAFDYAVWFLWPNHTIWIFPGEPNFLILKMNPDGPEKTIEHIDWFLPSKDASKQLQEAMVYMDEILQPEDIALCESVQKGLHSKGYNQGRFVVDEQCSGLSEHAVHHFQAMVVDALGAELES